MSIHLAQARPDPSGYSGLCHSLVPVAMTSSSRDERFYSHIHRQFCRIFLELQNGLDQNSVRYIDTCQLLGQKRSLTEASASVTLPCLVCDCIITIASDHSAANAAWGSLPFNQSGPQDRKQTREKRLASTRRARDLDIHHTFLMRFFPI